MGLSDLFDTSMGFGFRLLRGRYHLCLYKGMQWAFCDSQHNVQATIKVVCTLSYEMTSAKCIVAERPQRWLCERACCRGQQYIGK